MKTIDFVGILAAKPNQWNTAISDYGNMVEEASKMLIAIFAVRSTRLSIYSIVVCHRFQ